MTELTGPQLTGPHRDALIEATVAEFASAGFEGASLNRIIRAAGISKSSFYHAVGSKAELLDAVVQTLIADVRARWRPPAPGAFAGDEFWPQADRVLDDLGALAASDRALALLGSIFYLPATGGADARTRLLETVRTWVGEVLQVGIRSGAVRDDLPAEALAAAAFGMLRGLDEWALSEPAAARTPASAPGILLRAMLAAQG
ncbi:TetR/AcrR family transcriptional regulator [Microbacterium sp. ARD32]|uniref:TetR/AcrR family transcriptional regulator n=1 Tax=Microbacterium sp. ARD32 TaxID=2962577 RepID=UPI0028828AA7|nr:TetR/AcrR family transcriptional regulator [Microbacterium sp. ARD32]MDT0157838.1 TetR/AcrR family transcriptional regulator [Microbacterium sp. ARD32]